MSIAARRMSRSAQILPLVNYTYGFEAGSAGSSISTAQTAPGDYPWSAVGIGSGSSLTYDPTHVLSGTMAAELVPSATSTAMRWTLTSAALQGTFRYYVWWDANPTADVTALWFGSDTSTKAVSVTMTSSGITRLYGTPTGSLYSTPASTLALGGWTRVEVGYRVDPVTSSNGQVRLAVYAGNSTTALSDSGWIAGDIGTLGITYVRVGKYDSASNTTPHWIDAIIFKTTALALIGPVQGSNIAPTANAGVDQTVSGATTVTLNGSGSSDPDGTIASYAWTQTGGTAVTLSSTTVAQPSFTAPSTASTLTFSLVVTDNQGATSPADSVVVSVNASGSGTPVDDAGSMPVGTASYAAPNGATYMATNGNDTTGSGTQAAPYRTLTKALASTATGGTIVVRGGSYYEGEDTQDQAYPKGVIVQNKQITIQNYPNEAVWFDGSTVVSGAWTKNGSTWNTPYDRIFDRSPTSVHAQADGTGASSGAGGWYLSSANPEACWPDLVLLDGVRLNQVTSLGDVTSGTFFIEGAGANDAYWFQGTKLHIGDNPAGREVRYASLSKFLTTTGTSTNLTLRGVGVRRYASYQGGFGVMYLGSTTTLENVWTEDVSCTFACTAGSSSDIFRKVTGRRIGFNYIGGNACDNLLIDRADIQGCNYDNWNLWGPAIAVMKITKTQGVTLTNSIISNNASTAFWTDQTVASPRVINCLIKNNTNRVVDFETSSDSILANCKVISNGSFSVYSNDSDTTQVWNCTFAENAWGVTGNGTNNGNGTSTSVPIVKIAQSPRRYDVSQYSYCIDSRQPSTYYSNYPSHQWTTNSFTVCNNVIARTGVNAYSMIIVENNGDSTRPSNSFDTMTTTINGNLYHWGGDKPPYPWALGKGYNNGFDIYQTFTAWQSGKGKDSSSTFATSDPLDSNYGVINTSLHANASALPTNIATLINQPSGSKHVGCFW